MKMIVYHIKQYERDTEIRQKNIFKTSISNYILSIIGKFL